MAVFKHRKLFPFQANQTTNCFNFCDSTCPYKCNPLPYPELIFPPPQPISPPPAFKTRDMPLSPFIIITVTLLASFFLFITYYAITVKNCGDCRENSENESPSSSDQLDDDFDQTHGLIIDHIHHPIWFITTVGLQQSVINSITVVKYKKGEGLIEGTECSVCLNEFQEDETLRVLPKCNHAFHIRCIDTWLHSHTNCPLCRANIVVSDAVSTPSLGSTESNSISLSGNEDTQVGIHENDGELRENDQVINSENRAGRETEGEGGLQHEQEHVVVDVDDDDDDDERRAKEDVNSNGNLDSPPEVQTIPRSISMDSASTASICLDMATFHLEGSSNNMMISKVRKPDSTKSPFSCSGRSLFLEQSPKSIQIL